MAPTLSAVLFDLSYTLLTNGRTEAFHAALERLAGVDAAFVHELLARADRLFARRHPDRVGDPVYDWIEDYTDAVVELAAPALGLPPAAARAAVAPAARVWAADGGAWRPYADVVPALEALRAMGVRLGAVSNWGAGGREVLRACGLAGWFDAVVLSAEAGVQKPDARIFQRALEALGCDPEGAVMVGDDYVNDIEGAGAAGLRGILLDRYGLSARAAPPCAVARSLRGVVMAAADPDAHLPPAVPRARGPVAARPSASVVLLRDGAAGVEVLMGIRAPHGAMPDVAAFPGGAVQEEDLDGGAGPGAARKSLPPRAADVPEPAFRRAAVRETFEETGIWLGGEPRPGEPERARLLAGGRLEMLSHLSGGRLEDLVALGWLEAPPHLAVRFYTRFYAAAMPPGETPQPHEGEFVRLEWWRPEDALGPGGPPLLPPTRAVLRRLAGHASAAALLEAARRSPAPWLTPRAPMPCLP
ncbi:MAG: HAD-IA family hydrolase [Firmicutes bacterium]|nr:HAD-IA family hydrolase [Bacillota bacterium]